MGDPIREPAPPLLHAVCLVCFLLGACAVAHRRADGSQRALDEARAARVARAALRVAVVARRRRRRRRRRLSWGFLRGGEGEQCATSFRRRRRSYARLADARALLGIRAAREHTCAAVITPARRAPRRRAAAPPHTKIMVAVAVPLVRAVVLHDTQRVQNDITAYATARHNV